LKSQIIPFPNTSHDSDPEAALAQRQVRATLERAIDRLPDDFRAIVVARLVEGMSIEETAELVGVLPQTVKTRLHRARALLKREIENQIGSVLEDAFPFAGHRCQRMADSVLSRLNNS
jgi:RNA polymerase sigma-70 factor (ECF subfamily)